ncbi:MAG TPA: hypothetical protein VIJ77_11380, partial [Candidatus Tumulicola sp.]
AHRARYGYDVPNERVELVNARATASGTLPQAQFAAHDDRPALPGSTPEPSAHRQVWGAGRFVPTPVFERAALTADAAIDGPAIVEQYDTSTYLAPGWSLNVRDELLVLTGAAVPS